MYRLLIFGGTTEGRELSSILSSLEIDITVSVATNEGKEKLSGIENIKCIVNRLTSSEMEELVERFDLVVDATHPFAKEVTKNIRLATEKKNVSYIRLIREGSGSSLRCFDSLKEVIEYLNMREGRVLATTGSRDIHEYKALNSYKERLVARVLPTIDGIEKCNSIGLTIDNIIAQRGPFTKELNIATIRAISAKYMVTKDSGAVGGLEEKIEAAKETGAHLLVIGTEGEAGYCLKEVVKMVKKQFSLSEKPKRYFPMFFNIDEKNILVVGGGKIALRRINTLGKFTKKIRVVAPKIDHEIISSDISVYQREFEIEDLSGADIVLALTDNREVNSLIHRECKKRNILCNIGDRKEECDFYFPGVVTSGNVVVGVTSSGENHKEAKKVTSSIKELLLGGSYEKDNSWK